MKTALYILKYQICKLLNRYESLEKPFAYHTFGELEEFYPVRVRSGTSWSEFGTNYWYEMDLVHVGFRNWRIIDGYADSRY